MTTTLDNDEPVIIAAVEGGGTSFRVAVAQVTDSNKHQIIHQTEIDSSRFPQDTLSECASFLQEHKPPGGYHALGVATFGPVGLNDRDSTYGCILPTSPKEAWRGVNLLDPLVKACQGVKPLSVRIETDVNAPALAEYDMVADELTSVAYVTVGTGVGVGLVINGKCVHGRMHPEGGHVAVQPLKKDDFGGYSWGAKCPYRGKHTVEGIASSVALTERLEQTQSSTNSLSRSVLAELDDEDEVWDHAANALANLCVTLLLTTSIEKIVLGGGIMKRRGLLTKIQNQTVALLNGYLELPSDMSQLITTSTWGKDAGLVGAIVLAQRAHTEDQEGENANSTDTSKVFASGFLQGVLAGTVLVAVALSLLGRRSLGKP